MRKQLGSEDSPNQQFLQRGYRMRVKLDTSSELPNIKNEKIKIECIFIGKRMENNWPQVEFTFLDGKLENSLSVLLQIIQFYSC